MKRKSKTLAGMLLLGTCYHAQADDVSSCHPADFVGHLERTYRMGTGTLLSEAEQFSLVHSLADQSQCTYVIRYHACVVEGAKKATAGIHFAASDGSTSRNINPEALESRSISLLETKARGLLIFSPVTFDIPLSYSVKGGGFFSSPNFSNIGVTGLVHMTMAEIEEAFAAATDFCELAGSSGQAVLGKMKKVVDGVALMMDEEAKAAQAKAAEEGRQQAEQAREAFERNKPLIKRQCEDEAIRRRSSSPLPSAYDDDGSWDQSCARVGVDVNNAALANQLYEQRMREDYQRRREGRRNRPPIQGFGSDWYR